jgi:hypothetical protein
MLPDGSSRGIQTGAYVGAPQIISLALSSANVQLLPLTAYRLWSSVDAFFQLGLDNTVTATTASHPLTAKLDIMLVTDRTNVWIAGIVSSGTGSLFISQLNTLVC